MGAPTYDNSGASSASGLVTSGTLSQSWTQDVAGVNVGGIVMAICGNSGSAGFTPTGTPTAHIGGHSLPYLGSVSMNNLTPPIGGFLAVWADVGIPTGTGLTSDYSISDAGQNAGNAFGLSFTFNGVGGFGALQTAFGSGGGNSVGGSSALDHLVFVGMGQYQGGSYTSLSFTAPQAQGASAPAYAAGYQAGASSVTGSGTSTPGAWAAVLLDILPVPASRRGLVIGQAVQASLR